MAIVAAVGLIGAAFAYFSDVETSSGNIMSAGTLNMTIQDNNQGPWDGTPVTASINFPALYPGQVITTDPISFHNSGTIDIRYIFGRFCELHQTDGIVAEPEGTGTLNNIANYIVLEAYLEKANGDSDFYEELFDATNANAYLDFWGFPEVGYITLADLVNATPAGTSTKTGMWFFDGGNSPTNPPLPVGGDAQIKFRFKLKPEITNIYQGDSVSFRIDFIGVQTDSNLDDSITEGLGELVIP